MIRRNFRVWLPAAALFQITACTGPDPQFFFLNTAATTTVSLVIARLVDALFAGVGA